MAAAVAVAAAVGPQQQAADAVDAEAERRQWVKTMRQQFSPEGMCGPDGEIDQDFFKPKSIILRLTDDEKWGAPQQEALYKVRCGASTPSSALSAAAVGVGTGEFKLASGTVPAAQPGTLHPLPPSPPTTASIAADHRRPPPPPFALCRAWSVLAWASGGRS